MSDLSTHASDKSSPTRDNTAKSDSNENASFDVGSDSSIISFLQSASDTPPDANTVMRMQSMLGNHATLKLLDNNKSRPILQRNTKANATPFSWLGIGQKTPNATVAKSSANAQSLLRTPITQTSHTPRIQREWQEESAGVYKQDALIEGIEWHGQRTGEGEDDFVMWYEIIDASKLPPDRKDDYEQHAGQKLSFQDWKNEDWLANASAGDANAPAHSDNSVGELAVGVGSGYGDSVASGYGVTGDMADMGYRKDALGERGRVDEQTGEKKFDEKDHYNNADADIGEGANIGVGLLGLYDVYQKLKSGEGDKLEATAQTATSLGQMSHGAAKLTKGIEIKQAQKSGKGDEHVAKETTEWTQFGDVGAAAGDGLASIGGLILTVKSLGDTYSKYKEDGGLTKREAGEATANTAETSLGTAQAGVNTGKDVVKAIGAGSDASVATAAQLALAAGIIGIVTGSITMVHGGLKYAQGYRNDGQLQKVKQSLQNTIKSLIGEKIPAIEEKVAQLGSMNPESMDAKTIQETQAALATAAQELVKLQSAVQQLQSFYATVAPTIDAMRKLEDQRMESGKMKMAGGAATAVSSALLLSGVGAPVVIAVAALGGILAIGGVVVNWRRNKKGNLAASIASKLDESGKPASQPEEEEEGSLSYQEMEKRLYKAYDNDIPAIMKGSNSSEQGLEKKDFKEIKYFGWEDKNKRLKKTDTKTLDSMDKVEPLSDNEKRNHWLQVQVPDEKKVIKEYPGRSDWVAMKLRASAHKSKASRNASAELIAHALYDMGVNSYKDGEFVDCDVQPFDESEEINVAQIERQTSKQLLQIADITPKKWSTWLKATDGDAAEMKEKIKAQVGG